MKRLAALCALLLAPLAAQAQGPVTPPAGPPAAGMRTLEQIEPRTPIPKSPAVPIAGPHFTITQPGSYYLTGNVEVASGNGIVIQSSNVTLDLNGFALISKTISPAAGLAIAVNANVRSIEIKNGRITGGSVRTPGAQPWQATYADVGWGYGISSVGVVTADALPRGVLISHMTVEQCKGGGISFAASCNIEHTMAVNNGNIGIDITGGSLLGVTSSYNGSNGVAAQMASISNVSATYNTNVGIYVERGSVDHCTAHFNASYGLYLDSGTADHCSAEANVDGGIAVTNGVANGCLAKGNGRSGISVGVGVAAHCVASGNSTNPSFVDKEITVSAGGQRDACVPATE